MRRNLKVFSEYNKNERELVASFVNEDGEVVEEILFSYPFEIDWRNGDEEWESAYGVMETLATYSSDMSPRKLKLKEIKQKPIYKFNNGFGATLCHNCGVIINQGFSDKLYCNECRKDDTS